MMKKSFIRKAMSMATVVAMTATMLSGCGSGSGGDSGSTGADTSGTGDNQSSGELVEVNMVSPTALASLDLCWVYAADALGFFEEEGIKVNMIECTDGSDPKILASGQADFAGFSPSVGLSAVDTGVTNVQAICNVVGYNMFGIAYNKESGISDWSDLEGQSIGFLADTASILYDPIISAAGVDVSTITYVNYGSAEYEALDSNQVPAMGTWLSEYYMCEGMGYDWDYLSGDDVLPQIANSLWVNTDFAEENPEIVKGFVRAVTKSMYACYANPEVVADIVLARYPSIEMSWEGAVGSVDGNAAGMFGIDKADRDASIEAHQIGIYDMDAVKQTIENLYNGGAITQMLDAETYYTNEYVTTDIDYAEIDAVLDAYEFSSDIYKESH